ncbi:633_t:CDS:2 [Ambispora leptoticha]|uniref:633_t:CDS:1 n=1 Tax=Ambispora leptoticha TaxID=144679 RepID=A0A9N8WD30_9GLOM|nr:633_t:CDS:2 [Ambispora leptoticha]
MSANNQSILRNGTQKLPDDIADIINDTQFWIILSNLQELLYPLCDFEFGSKMVTRIGLRWNKWEQLLRLLSFALYPRYKFNTELIQYKRGINPYDTELFMHFNGNLVDFWESTEGVGPELARVAIHDETVEHEPTTIGFDYQTNQNSEENEDLVTGEEQSDWDTDFSLGGREKHPADDETAKWSLDSLFISSLEMLVYFDSEFTVTGLR